MDILLQEIIWLPVLVSTGLAFLVGWAWYSPALFLKLWLAGLPAPPKWQAPLWMPMSTQFVATFLLAVVVQALQQSNQLGLVVLLALLLMGFVKANGMYSGKAKVAIAVEVSYLAVMVAIMVAANSLLI